MVILPANVIWLVRPTGLTCGRMALRTSAGNAAQVRYTAPRISCSFRPIPPPGPRRISRLREAAGGGNGSNSSKPPAPEQRRRLTAGVTERTGSSDSPPGPSPESLADASDGSNSSKPGEGAHASVPSAAAIGETNSSKPHEHPVKPLVAARDSRCRMSSPARVGRRSPGSSWRLASRGVSWLP